MYTHVQVHAVQGSVRCVHFVHFSKQLVLASLPLLRRRICAELLVGGSWGRRSPGGGAGPGRHAPARLLDADPQPVDLSRSRGEIALELKLPLSQSANSFRLGQSNAADRRY